MFDSNHSMSLIGSLWNERSTLFFNPFGGSFVIFTPFCRTVTGKSSDGYEVSQSRKSVWVVSGRKPSQICSSFPIQLFAKWQFCSTTQLPNFVPSSTIFDAIGPWPWPSESEKSRFMPKPWSSANLRSVAMGSEPGVKMKISGMQLCESSYDAERSNGGGSVNFAPIFSLTKSWIAGTSLSGRKHRRMRSLRNCVRLLHGLGRSSLLGSSELK